MKVRVIKGPLFERCIKQSHIYLRGVIEKKIQSGEYKANTEGSEKKA